MGMIHRRHGARFLLESAPPLGVGRDVGRQHLDGHGPIESRVAPLVDLAHPARADERDDLIRAEARAGREGHVKTERTVAPGPDDAGFIAQLQMSKFDVDAPGRP